jgi:hypothetical protein
MKLKCGSARVIASHVIAARQSRVFLRNCLIVILSNCFSKQPAMKQLNNLAIFIDFLPAVPFGGQPFAVSRELNHPYSTLAH